MKKRILLGLFVCVLAISLCGCGKSIEKQLIDGGIWCDLDGQPQAVFFADGTAKDLGGPVSWSITEDDQLYVSGDGWSETYSIIFEEGTHKLGPDMYLYLIDSDGDETVLQTGLMAFQDWDYDFSYWEQ